MRNALVAQNLNIGRLVARFPEQRLPISWSYWQVYTAASLQCPEVKAFHDWLPDEMQGL